MNNFNLFLFLLIILLPLTASITAGLLGRKLGDKGVHFITTSSLILSSILITYAFYEVGLNNNPQYLTFTSWVNCEYLVIKWELIFDQLSVSLAIAVIWCSTLIHIYSIDYLASDPHIQRFFSYLSAFTAGMLILIFGGNYFVMFVGWEAIGVVSYLLINFYFTRIQANKAAILAFCMNRAGDMLLSISFFSLFNMFGTVSYSGAFSLSPLVNTTGLTITGFLIFGGALAKSANIPFQSWLPGSMEAPTPVSALLHAATLVTAGVYLLLRSSPILEYTPNVLLCITFIGSTTALYGATSGLLQNDLKRIIAMSTISQLGYMFMAIGLSNYNVALFHTVNHAFFKALLFLCAGAIIHSFNDQQDIRKMGGLIKFMPFVYSCMLVGTLSLMALPFLTGFYSKDLILELAYSKYTFNGMYAYILGSITAGITAFYSFRLISLVFLQEPNGQRQSYSNAHESNIFVIIPLLTLAIFSIVFGYFMSDLFVGIGSDFFQNSIFILPENTNIIEAELLSLESYLKTADHNIFGEHALSLRAPSHMADGQMFNLDFQRGNLVIKLLPTFLSIFGALLGLFLYNKTNYFRLLTGGLDYLWKDNTNKSLKLSLSDIQSNINTDPNGCHAYFQTTPQEGGKDKVSEIKITDIRKITSPRELMHYKSYFTFVYATNKSNDKLNANTPLSGGAGENWPAWSVNTSPILTEHDKNNASPQDSNASKVLVSPIEYNISLPLGASNSKGADSHMGAFNHPVSKVYPVTKSNSLWKKLYSFFNGKYYFDIVYNNFVFSKGLHLSYIISKEIDRGIIEFIGPYGLSNLFLNTGKNISKLDTGIITTYALYIAISLLLFTFVIFYEATTATIDPVQAHMGNEVYSEVVNTGIVGSEMFKLIIIILFCLFILPYNNKNSSK